MHRKHVCFFIVTLLHFPNMSQNGDKDLEFYLAFSFLGNIVIIKNLIKKTTFYTVYIISQMFVKTVRMPSATEILVMYYWFEKS